MAFFNISSFFGNSSTNSFSSFNFADYASIRNGSYGRLLKAYYSQAKQTTTTKSDTDKKADKTTDTDNTGLSKMKKEADGLKEAADKLANEDMWKKTGGEYDMDKIASAVKSFANEYNDVIDQSSKVGTKDVTMQTGFMTSMTKTMSNALSKVGVTVGADGRLSVNEDTLKKADAKDVKSLFSGDYSYAGQIAEKAGAISSAAVRNSSLYTSNGLLSSVLRSSYNNWI